MPAAGKYKVVVTVLDKTGHAFTGEKAVTIGLATFWNQIVHPLRHWVRGPYGRPAFGP